MYREVSDYIQDCSSQNTAKQLARPVELVKKMDVPACASIFNYYAGAGYHVLGETSLNSTDYLNISVRQPYGVVGLIIPWNVNPSKPIKEQQC